MDGAGPVWMRWLRGSVAGVAIALACSLQAVAASGEVAGAADAKRVPGVSRFDSIELRPPAAAGELKPGSAGAPASGAMEASRVVVALGAVIGLIFGVRWAGRRFLGINAGSAGSGGAVRVLSKTMLAPRQQLMLVQVGRRIVLVANTGAQMNALCEISDPEEVAALVGEVHARPERIVGAPEAFLAAFGRAGRTYGGDDDGRAAKDAKSAPRAEDDGSIVPPTRAELAGLLEKVRLMSGGFRKG